MKSIAEKDELFVSVIIPAYNASQYIEEAINSVLSQSHQSFEIIVVQNGSDDGILEILRKFGNKNFRVFVEPKQGPAYARNRGIHEAKGKWLAFLDADDLWLPDKLKLQIECLKVHPSLDLVSTNCFVFTSSQKECASAINFSNLYRGELSEKKLLKQLIYYNFVATSSVLVRRSICETVGLFNEDIELASDYDMWLRLASAGGRFFFLDKPLLRYRRHPLSWSAQNLEKGFKFHLEILKRNFIEHPGLFTKKEIRKILGYIHINFGHIFLQKNKKIAAVKNLIQGFCYNPLNRKAFIYLVLLFMPKDVYAGLRRIKEFVLEKARHPIKRNNRDVLITEIKKKITEILATRNNLCNLK